VIDREPSVKEMAVLYSVCVKFIEDQNINCGEAVYQNDNVILNACQFIEQICDIVGYDDEY
jgi:hypothetical protein